MVETGLFRAIAIGEKRPEGRTELKWAYSMGERDFIARGAADRKFARRKIAREETSGGRGTLLT